TLLVGDARQGEDLHMRRVVAFGQSSLPQPGSVTPAGLGNKAREVPVISSPMKGDRQWLQDGQATALTRPVTRTQLFDSASGPTTAAEQNWRAQLHTDVPRF
ncbi:unnamed protein product, partial [Polarella glacialis]